MFGGCAVRCRVWGELRLSMWAVGQRKELGLSVLRWSFGIYWLMQGILGQWKREGCMAAA